MEHDALSVSMFWAGALMAFAPLVFAGIVLFFWRRSMRAPEGRAPEGGASTGQPASDSAHALGSTTRPK